MLYPIYVLNHEIKSINGMVIIGRMIPNLLNFIILAMVLGPAGSIPYGLEILSPLEIFIILLLLYTLPIPFIFKLFEYGGHHRRIYRMRIFKKASEITGKEIEDMIEKGDRITSLFEKRMGHLGLYATIVIFTIVFGVFWASLFSYLLMVKRRRAIYSMIIGIIMGNTFWIIVISYFRSVIKPLEMMLIAILIPLWIYGTKREMDILKKIAK